MGIYDCGCFPDDVPLRKGIFFSNPVLSSIYCEEIVYFPISIRWNDVIWVSYVTEFTIVNPDMTIGLRYCGFMNGWQHAAGFPVRH